MSKTCTDSLCEQVNPQPLSEFYDHHDNYKQSVCKTCMKRRATIAVYRRRDENEAAGLPRCAPAEQPNAYLERHHRNRLRELEIAESLQNEHREVEVDPFDHDVTFGRLVVTTKWHKGITNPARNGLVKL